MAYTPKRRPARAVKHIKGAERAIVHKAGRGRQAVFERFPLPFTLLGTFGVVATFYGFEGLIDNIDVLADNPWILLGTGIAILAGTGTLYKRLQ